MHRVIASSPASSWRSGGARMRPSMGDILSSGLRESNRLRVLELLLRHPSRSRAELGRRLGLSRATVTAVLSELERAGMVLQQSEEPAEPGRKAIGRPPLHVSLAPDA